MRRQSSFEKQYLPFYSAFTMEMNNLIYEIKNREVLWNTSHPQHEDKVRLDKEWNKVAKNTGFTSK